MPETTERVHLTATYTPASTGMHTLDIYCYRNYLQTDVWNYIDSISLAPVSPALTIDPCNTHVWNTGSNTLAVDAGVAHANEPYIILAATGPTPNFSLDGVLIHLAYDNIFQYTLANKNTAMFSNTYGVLDASGQATATFTTFSWLPQWQGKTVTFCALGLSSGGVRPIQYATNPVLLNFIP